MNTDTYEATMETLDYATDWLRYLKRKRNNGHLRRVVERYIGLLSAKARQQEQA